ncbi:helix-turn-helix transcriptional regulator [Streptomyces sp. MN03-5084-2B]|nr:helix-turn-helix transcriptional regulator [Streptomyces sp. MN03-5084-2B]
MINDTVRHPGSWLDARSLMDQAAREDAAELAEHGALQPTLADDAKRAYEHFKIGVWHLEQDDPGEALRWLRTAVEQDIVEAEPLLEICLQALESVPAGRAAHDDEHEAVASERQVDLSTTEDDQELDDESDGESTPIYDAVTGGVIDDHAGRLWTFQTKFSPTDTATGVITEHVEVPGDLPSTSTSASRRERTFWNAVGKAASPVPVEAEPFYTRIGFNAGRESGLAAGTFTFRYPPPALQGVPELQVVVRYSEERCRHLERELPIRFGRQCHDLGQLWSLTTPWSVEWTKSGLLLPPGSDATTSPSAPTQRTPDALGEVERRVAFLAARGMSGVDIAAELGLPYVTAMAHFVRICRKLGVTGREGLRAALGSGGWRDSQPDERVSTSSGV